MKKIKSGAAARKPAADNIQSKNNLFLNDKRRSFDYNFSSIVFGFLLFVLILQNFGCQSPSLKANSTKPSANVIEDNVPSLEKDLQTMRNADFDFIYVFRRKDGNVLDADDKKYLKANSPVFTNRFVLTEENKAAIAGSSYKFEKENLDNLQKRFVLENFSKPESQPTTVDSNSNK